MPTLKTNGIAGSDTARRKDRKAPRGIASACKDIETVIGNRSDPAEAVNTLGQVLRVKG